MAMIGRLKVATPYPALRDFPLFRGQNGLSMLSNRIIWNAAEHP